VLTGSARRLALSDAAKSATGATTLTTAPDPSAPVPIHPRSLLEPAGQGRTFLISNRGTAGFALLLIHSSIRRPRPQPRCQPWPRRSVPWPAPSFPAMLEPRQRTTFVLFIWLRPSGYPTRPPRAVDLTKRRSFGRGPARVLRRRPCAPGPARHRLGPSRWSCRGFSVSDAHVRP